MESEREVAGLRCNEVLTELSDYLDGTLPPARRAQVTAHLQGCDICERFDRTFSTAIRALRESGFNCPAEAPPVFERLRTRLTKGLAAP